MASPFLTPRPRPSQQTQSPQQPQGPSMWPMRPKLPMPPQIQPVDVPTGALEDAFIPEPPGHSIQPSAFDPTAGVESYARYDGPKLNNQAALAGLRNTQVPSTMGSYGSREELYKKAYSQPRVVEGFAQGMPGQGERFVTDPTSDWSRKMAQDTLGNVQDDENFAREEARFGQQQIGRAITGHHPAIQGLAEATAQRAAYPAEAQAEGLIASADTRAQSDMMTGAMDMMEKRRIASLIPIDALVRAIQEYDTSEFSDPTADQRRQQMIEILGIALTQRGQ